MGVLSKQRTSSSLPLFLCVILFNLVALFAEESETYSKTPVKIIETEHGDVIHCVQLSKEALKLHQKIKVYIGKADEEDSGFDEKYKRLITTSKYGGCPSMSIPIWRYCKRSAPVQEAGSGSASGDRDHKATSGITPTNSLNRGPLHHKEYAMLLLNRTLRGARAGIVVQKPFVAKSDSSLAYIRVVAGTDGEKNAIEAAWQVNPSGFHGDTRPHLYLYTTRDNYKSGHHARDHPLVFIPNPESQIALDAPFVFLSKSKWGIVDNYKSPYQFKLQMDPVGNWHFWVGPIHVGHFPSDFQPHLSVSASSAYYGGEVSTDQWWPPHTVTHMGNGHFPDPTRDRDFQTAASFADVKFLAPEISTWSTPHEYEMKDVTTNSACYAMMNVGMHPTRGYTFYYGGTGYNPRCRE